jgi:cell division protein FtsQ
MDGRRRLAEPVTEGARAHSAAGAAPGPRRARLGSIAGRTRFLRGLRRRLGPLEELRLPRGVGIAAAIALVLGAVVFGVVRGGHVAEFTAQLRDGRDALANAAGFRISTIALSGVRQLSGDDVLDAAGITARSSLLFLDAADLRTRLKANPWIADATVLKLYPGRLNIAITERDAFALWQKDGKVAVIAADGAVVEPYVASRFTGLPLVVGAGAETRAKEFLALLEKYPAVRSQLQAGVLIAERRWNLVLSNGIEVRLPEAGFEQALDTLLQLNRDNKILSRDITAVDLRLPDRVTVQLSDEAAAARQEALKSKAPKKKAGAA